MINTYLMANMRMVTWVQYSIYMAIGKWKNKKICIETKKGNFAYFLHVRFIGIHRLRLAEQQRRETNAGEI